VLYTEKKAAAMKTFSLQDISIESGADFLDILPIFIFVAFVGPFLLVAYTVGLISDLVGWLD
jgi:hypothetical protein